MELQHYLETAWSLIQKRPDLAISLVAFGLIAGFDAYEQAQAQQKGETWQSAVLRILARMANLLIIGHLGGILLQEKSAVFKTDAAYSLILAAEFFYLSTCLGAELKVKDRSLFVGWPLGILRVVCKGSSFACLGASGVITGLEFARFGWDFFLS